MTESDLGSFSIFDTYNKIEDSYNIFEWKKPPPNFKFNKKNEVHNGILREFNPETNKIDQTKFYVATNSLLLRFDKILSDIPEALLKFSMVCLKYFSNPNFGGGFSLISQGISFTFICNSEDDLNIWLKKLGQESKTILLNIDKSYTIFRTIKNSENSRVQIGINIHTENQYWIKSFSKQYLLNSPLAMVILVYT